MDDIVRQLPMCGCSCTVICHYASVLCTRVLSHQAVEAEHDSIGERLEPSYGLEASASFALNDFQSAAWPIERAFQG